MSASESDDDAIVGVSESDASEKTSSSDDDNDDGSVSADFMVEGLDAPPRDHETLCEVCGEGDDEPRLILCDGCDGGWHTYCLRPKLPSVPRGEWRCDACARARAEAETARRAARPRRAAFKRAEAMMVESSDGDGDGDTGEDDEKSDVDLDADSDAVGGGGRKSAKRFYDLNASEDAPRRPRRAAAARGRDFSYRFDDNDDDDDALAREGVPYDAVLCAKCKLGDDPQNFLLCDGCDDGWHTYCLRPKLPCAPRGEWLCPSCVTKREKAHAATLESKKKRAELDLAAGELMRHKKAHLVLASRAVATSDGAMTAAVETNGDGIPGNSALPKSVALDNPLDARVQFLVKFEGESYRRARWVPLWAMRHREPHKLRGHWKRTGATELAPEAPVDRAAYEHVVPERVVDESDERDAVLVKWCGLPYDECTWEPRESFARKNSAEREASEREFEREFAFGAAADEARANRGVAGLLTAELRAYRARIARPPPAVTLKRDFGDAGVRFQDFEPLLRGGGGAGGGASSSGGAASAARLKAAAAAAAAAGAADLAPTSLTLHPYQREGVRWLLNKLVSGQSAILGDQMGLGKTIQAASFCDGARALGLLSGPVLIVAPKSTVPNWSAELRVWCPTLDCVTYAGSKTSREALKRVDFPFPSHKGSGWRRSGGGSFTDVVLANYEVAIADASAFRTVRWGAVIVDEGHRLKNQNSALTQTLLSLRCPWRLLLTGTPLQNNLEELFALLHFLDPRRFARPEELAAAFTDDRCLDDARDERTATVQNGSARHSELSEISPREDNTSSSSPTPNARRVETLRFELRNLHALLEKHMLRRLKRDVLRGLPKKRAVEVSVPLAPFQREVYADVLARNHAALNSTVNATQRTTLNNTLKELQKVCNHPFLYPAAEQDAFKAARKSGLAGKLARDATRQRRVYREKVARDNETVRLAGAVAGGYPASTNGAARHEKACLDVPDAVWIDCTRVTPPMPPLEPLPATLLRTSSGKMQLLAKLLPALRARGHRVLLFCQMTRMLDVIDDWLRASGVGMERDPSDPSGMRGRRVYSRVDGATPSTTRQRAIESFNSEDSETFLMLVSTRAGGLGLNLATADTVIMYDPDFNPFVDEQAQSRAHRMGQRKEVVVYQLVTAESVEERIVELAKSKRAIERLVVKRGKEEGRDVEGDGGEKTDANRKGAKDVSGSVSRAAELAKVLMHGARKIVTRAASGSAAETAKRLEKRVNAKCEFKDAEIERLLDRENLPLEADGEDGDGYLGGVGDGRVRLENDEDEDERDEARDDASRSLPDAAFSNDDPEDLADKQLESLLAERAARLVSAERELLGRGKRERRRVLPNNEKRKRKMGEETRGGSAIDPPDESLNATGTLDDVGPNFPNSDLDPFVAPCFICRDDETDAENLGTLLRCEACSACVHPACAGVDEEDAAALFPAAPFASVPASASRGTAWYCGSGGVSCACHGKRIEGGRAAAVAAAERAYASSRPNVSGSEDSSESESAGGADAGDGDGDDGYDPERERAGDSESESAFSDFAPDARGRKKRRLSGSAAPRDGNQSASHPARVSRLEKTRAAFVSQIDWLRANETLVATTTGDPVAACVAASAEFERLSSLAAAFDPAEAQTVPSRGARTSFPIDLLLVLRAGFRLDLACAAAADAVWAPRFLRSVDEAHARAREASARAAKCDEAYRATLDPTRFRRVAAQKNWSDEDARLAAANVTELRRAAHEETVRVREAYRRAVEEYNALRRFTREAPSRTKPAFERHFQATLSNPMGAFAGKYRRVAQTALKRAVASFASLSAPAPTAPGGARAFFEETLAAFAEVHAAGTGDAESARDLRGAAEFLFRDDASRDDGVPADGTDEPEGVRSPEELLNVGADPAQVLGDSTWRPYVTPSPAPGDASAARQPVAAQPRSTPVSGAGAVPGGVANAPAAPAAVSADRPPANATLAAASRSSAPATTPLPPGTFPPPNPNPNPNLGALGAFPAPGFPPRAPPISGLGFRGAHGAGAPTMTFSTFHGPVTFAGGAPPHVAFGQPHVDLGLGMVPPGTVPAGIGGPPPGMVPPPGMGTPLPGTVPAETGTPVPRMMDPRDVPADLPWRELVLACVPAGAPNRAYCEFRAREISRTVRERLDAQARAFSGKGDAAGGACLAAAHFISTIGAPNGRRSGRGVDIVGEHFGGCTILASDVLRAVGLPSGPREASAAARAFNSFEVARFFAELAREGVGAGSVSAANPKAATARTEAAEPRGEPPPIASSGDPPAAIAAIDLTADDDDVVDDARRDEDEEKDESRDVETEPARVVSGAAPSPALERQVKAFFKRRRDEEAARRAAEAERPASEDAEDAEDAEPPARRVPEADSANGSRAIFETARDAAPISHSARMKSAEPEPEPEPVPHAETTAEPTTQRTTQPTTQPRDPPVDLDAAARPREVSSSVGGLGYHRAPPGCFDPGNARLVPATSLRDEGSAAFAEDVEPSPLRAMPGEWAFAAVGPVEALADVCDAFPRGRPVKFVKKMHNAHGRWGVALETRAGCVRLCTHDPARPGKPTKLWFPLEALRALRKRVTETPIARVREDERECSRLNVHVARLLEDVALVRRLCDTLPAASPVRFVRAIEHRCGSAGALVESRGEIVKVRFAAREALSEETKRSLSDEAVASLRRPFTTWLPVECVAIVTPWA